LATVVGVRIPKPILEQCGIEDEIEINVKDDTIIIHSPRIPREGWDHRFQAMNANQDSSLSFRVR